MEFVKSQKEKKQESNRKYRELHPDYFLNYWSINREKYHENITCDICCKDVSRGSYLKHEKSKTHQRLSAMLDQIRTKLEDIALSDN